MFASETKNIIDMNLYLIIFNAETYRKEQVYEAHKSLFVALEKFFTLHLVNYTQTDEIPSSAYKMAFIASGGVESAVVRNFSLLPYPITLLTDGTNNSLAAALEISAWIRTRDMKVKIIHGHPDEMVKQVLLHHKAFAAKRSLKNKRIGVVGIPAHWLVASHVDYLLAGQRWGVSYIDIPIKEIEKNFYDTTDDEIGMEATRLVSRAKAIQEATPEDLYRAMRLHKAVRNICAEHKLDAVTVSCFSLIQTLKTTGCLAFSLLNDEGIPAGCEGDLQAIMSLLMIKELTGQPGFMANPSFIDTKRNEILLAHCSIPTSMTDEFIIRSHFESGTGIGIQGLMHEGEVTLFKCGGECLDEYFVSPGYLTGNTNLMTSCRTQLMVKLDKPVSYFLQNPLGNHHVLIKGNHAEAIQEFMQQNRCKQRE